MTTAPQKITFGERRESGVRDVLIYCRDHKCSHHIEISTDRWPNQVRLSDIEPDFVCLRQAWRRRSAKISAGTHGDRQMPWSKRFTKIFFGHRWLPPSLVQQRVPHRYQMLRHPVVILTASYEAA
jgi:hypothetical protein